MPSFKEPPPVSKKSGHGNGPISQAADLAKTAPGQWVEADGEWSQGYATVIRRFAGTTSGVLGMRTGMWEVTTRKADSGKWKVYLRYLGEE